MRVVEKMVAKNLRFECPDCGAELEAELFEVTKVDLKYSVFYCLQCKTLRRVKNRKIKTIKVKKELLEL